MTLTQQHIGGTRIIIDQLLSTVLSIGTLERARQPLDDTIALLVFVERWRRRGCIILATARRRRLQMQVGRTRMLLIEFDAFDDRVERRTARFRTA